MNHSPCLFCGKKFYWVKPKRLPETVTEIRPLFCSYECENAYFAKVAEMQGKSMRPKRFRKKYSLPPKQQN